MTTDTATIDCPVKCEGCDVVVPMAGALHTEDPVYLCGKCAAGAVESQMRSERDAAIAARDEAVARLEARGNEIGAEAARVLARAERARDEALAREEGAVADALAWRNARDEAVAEATQWREALTEIVREIDDEDGCMGIDCEPLDPKETSAQRLVTAVVRRVADLQSWTRRYVMGDRMMGDATSEEEAARSRVATLVADRDAALIARDEVGIQLAAAQARIKLLEEGAALLRDISDDARAVPAGFEGHYLVEKSTIDIGVGSFLAHLDAVPGDALAPKLTAALEASGIDAGNVKGVG